MHSNHAVFNLGYLFQEPRGSTDGDYWGTEEPPRTPTPEIAPCFVTTALAPPLAAPGKHRGRPHTQAPGAPTRAVSFTGAAHAAACSGSADSGRLRGARGGHSRRLAEFSEDAATWGASSPSVHQSPDASEIRLWVCGERNATQTPFYRALRK